jgi:hypothetical protein
MRCRVVACFFCSLSEIYMPDFTIEYFSQCIQFNTWCAEIEEFRTPLPPCKWDAYTSDISQDKVFLCPVCNSETVSVPYAVWRSNVEPQVTKKVSTLVTGCWYKYVLTLYVHRSWFMNNERDLTSATPPSTPKFYFSKRTALYSFEPGKMEKLSQRHCAPGHHPLTPLLQRP